MRQPANILIVDDETNIRLMLRTALESVGYVVAEAADGRAALEAIEARVPDLMLLDLSMPILDGIEVLKTLQPMRPGHKPRVIVLTAYGSIATAVKATRLGAVDFLEKPVAPDEVREAIEAAMAEPLLDPVVPGTVDGGSLSGGYAGVLDRIRRALRLADYTDAETLLMKAADLGCEDPAYFNLLGVLYETQRRHRLAKKFYGKSIRADRRYEPAQKNMRRIYELNTFGASQEAAALGDESDDWLARLPVQR